MSQNPRREDLCADGVEELTAQELMLCALDGAKGRDLDDRDYLLSFCRIIPRKEWPPPVAAFFDQVILPPSQWRRKKVYRLSDLTKRTRGRPVSRLDEIKRFWRDPNRIAAHLASNIVRNLRGGHDPASPRRHKIELPDGSKRPVQDEAVRLAIEKLAPQMKANPDRVKDLLRRGRTHKLDLNGDD